MRSSCGPKLISGEVPATDARQTIEEQEQLELGVVDAAQDHLWRGNHRRQGMLLEPVAREVILEDL